MKIPRHNPPSIKAVGSLSPAIREFNPSANIAKVKVKKVISNSNFKFLPTSNIAAHWKTLHYLFISFQNARIVVVINQIVKVIVPLMMINPIIFLINEFPIKSTVRKNHVKRKTPIKSNIIPFLKILFISCHPCNDPIHQIFSIIYTKTCSSSSYQNRHPEFHNTLLIYHMFSHR